MSRLPHLAAKIPWQALASHFRWVPVRGVVKFDTDYGEPARVFSRFDGDLQLECEAGQGEQLRSFVDAMAKTLREHSVAYRRRYPERYEPASPDEIILDDTTIRKIYPTVRRWTAAMPLWDSWRPTPLPDPSPNGICQHKGGLGDCRCPIPQEERRTAAFHRKYDGADCMRFYEQCGKEFYNLEMVKTLLLYGEMDTVLRVCAHPEVDLRMWQTAGQCTCLEEDAGWDRIYNNALLPYIALNLIYCFPETWDRTAVDTEVKDYRQMRMYLEMFKECTHLGYLTSQVVLYPHWDFLRRNKAGRFADSDQPKSTSDQLDYYTPSEDTLRAQQILLEKGVPADLVSEIMDTAEHGPSTKPQMQNDPFHPDNRKDLERYLKYCWQLLVRCDMMATVLGLEIPWHELISYAMAYRLIGDGPDGRKWFTTDYRKALEDRNAWTYTFF